MEKRSYTKGAKLNNKKTSQHASNPSHYLHNYINYQRSINTGESLI